MNAKKPQSLEEQLAAELLSLWESPELTETVEEQERRARPRVEFPYMQLVAPIHDDRPPAEHDLRRARCQDISASGFAFYDVTYPETERLVVGFGAWPDIMYLKAEVIHITPTLVEEEYMYKIGCRYTERLTPAQMQVLEEKAAQQECWRKA